MNEEPNYFAAALRFALAERGDAKTLAHDCGISETTVSLVADGKRHPSEPTKRALLRSLNYKEIDFLLLGKSLVEQLPNIPDASIPEWAKPTTPADAFIGKSLDPVPISTNNDIIIRLLDEQSKRLDLLSENMQHMKDERIEIYKRITKEQLDMWGVVNSIRSHIDKLNETLDEINRRLVRAAESGDLKSLEPPVEAAQ